MENIVTAKDLSQYLKTSGSIIIRTLVETSPDAIALIDLNTNILMINQQGMELAGYKNNNAGDIIGKSILEFIAPKDRSQVAENVLKPVETGSIRNFQCSALKKDGTQCPVELNASLIVDKGGKPRALMAVLRDITERKRAEMEKTGLQEQLHQSQKMEAIGQLAGDIAHDFNNLLFIIKGYTNFSLHALKEDDPLQEKIKEIQKATERATALVRQLLNFSRHQVMEMKVLDLNTLLKGLDKMLHQVICEDIELVMRLAENLGKVKVDPQNIEQVILNLVVNARDAMPSGGELFIETANAELDEEYARTHNPTKPGPYVMLSVSDTGVGMTSEVKERIFEPFFTTKEKDKGTGLGLSTVYRLIKQSRGNIWVYSEPGKGTKFEIYLPRVDESLEGGGV
jgi:two-component system, cell cycle sensor histidine kinase and response regulator CckA